MRILVETRRRAIYLSGVILLLLMSLCGRTFAEDEEILPGRTEEPSDGCVWIGVYGDYCGDQQETLDRINQIRYEACIEGIPDPRNPSRSLQPSDYKALKWSSSLEETARIRASEALYIIAHARHNGKEIGTANGTVFANAEDIAWNYGKSMVDGINQWYSEKEEWLKEVAGEEHDQTGHYTSMINPNYRYVGVGTIYSSSGLYPNATVGKLSSTTSSVDESFLPLYSGIIQKVDVLKSYLSDYTVSIPATVGVGESREVITNVSFTRNNITFTVRYLGSLQYSSGNTAVATVDATGHVRGVKAGTADITVSLNGTVLGTSQITVVSGYSIADTTITINPSRVLYDGKAKTPEVIVKNDGKRLTAGTDYSVVYSDNKLVGTATVTITGKGMYSGTKTATFEIYCNHNCNYGPANDNNQIEGDCSICHNHVVVNVPSLITAYWKNEETMTGSYWSVVPKINPVGSEIGLLIDVNGEEGFQDLWISYSDTSKLTGPTEVRLSSVTTFQVCGSGMATITFTPKWNPNKAWTYTFMLGDPDISKADVTLSRESAMYTGAALSNNPTVKWGGRYLENDTDYTVTYKNNVNVGTATVVITGKGDFSGTIKKTFQIVPKQITGAYAYSRSELSAQLSESLVMRFGIVPSPANYSSYADADPYVIFTVDGNYRAKQYLKDAETYQKNNMTYYIMECPVNVKESSDTITMTFYVNDNVMCTTAQSYSVKQYCEFLINNNFSDEEKALARALITYSAYAREYFNYKTSELTAGDKPNTLSSKQTVKNAISGKISVSGSSQHATYEGISLVLLAETGMRFYITPDASILAGDNRFKTNNSGQYYIAVADAKLGNLDAKKTVKVDGLTVSASPLHYIKSVLQYSTNTKLINLCLAMYDCYTAAKAYQGQ